MNVYINSKLTQVPDEISDVEKLLIHLNIPKEGTGVCLNGRLVKAADRGNTFIKEEDDLLVISATFGG